MGAILTHLAAAFVAVTVWEMAKKVWKDYKISQTKSRFFDPHEQIYH